MVKVPSVPNFFICPVSSEVMKDPVTLCTGQTYDRGSIEKWFASGHDRCPSTMQVLSNRQLVPNDYLRGLIASWRTSNHPRSTQEAARVAPPAAAIGVPVLKHIFAQLQKKPTKDSLKVLRNLRIQMKGMHSMKRNVVEAGGVAAICHLIFASVHLSRSEVQSDDRESLEEALALLILLPSASIRAQEDLLSRLVTVISWLLSSRFSSTTSRIRAATLLARLLTPSNEDHDPNEVRSITKHGACAGHDEDGVMALVGASVGVFEGLVHVLQDESCQRAREAGLKACLALLQSKHNIVKGVEAGLVVAVIELLGASEGRTRSTGVRRALALLELIAGTEQGLRNMSNHALTIPILAKLIIQDASFQARAVSCLWALCSQLGTEDAEKCIREALSQDGLSTKLLELSRSSTSRSGAAAYSPETVAREQNVVYLKSLLQCKSRTCAQIATCS